MDAMEEASARACAAAGVDPLEVEWDWQYSDETCELDYC